MKSYLLRFINFLNQIVSPGVKFLLLLLPLSNASGSLLLLTLLFINEIPDISNFGPDLLEFVIKLGLQIL